MASCPKCGRGKIKKRYGVKKCKRCGPLPCYEVNMSELLWWGYRHTNGEIQAKRWYYPFDMDDAKESPFVAGIYGPFKATGRDEALKILEQNV